MKNSRLVILLTVVLSLVVASAALAITAPANGAFAYDLYKVAVVDILQGPIGFVAGVGAIVFGAMSAIQAKILLAVPAILGGAALLKADGIVNSMGING